MFAGDLTAYMALPWQADFYACGFNSTPPPDFTWWPVLRPNLVIPEGEANYRAWDRDVGSRRTDDILLAYIGIRSPSRKTNT